MDSENSAIVFDFKGNNGNKKIIITPVTSPRKLAPAPLAPQVQQNIRSSPRSSPRRISRLPVRTNDPIRFSIKDLRLPAEAIEEPLAPLIQTARVTPEMLMEELREEVKMKKRMQMRRLDDEISLLVPFDNLDIQQAVRPRMSLRNRCPIVVDAPDLVYEDPLEIARQTLQNTRANSGYKHCKLIYTTERRTSARRCSSPEPAFSKKTGITRHFLNDSEEGIESAKLTRLKFDKMLKFHEEEGEEIEIDYVIKEPVGIKPCIKKKTDNTCSVPPALTVPREIVQIKRVCYEGEEDFVFTKRRSTVNADLDDDDVSNNNSPTKKRRLGGNGAKRLKKND